MIKLIIADDHRMILDGIKSILKSKKNISVVGEAHDGEEVLKLLEDKKADIVLMDINMPGMDGIEATIEIKKRFPKTNVLMLTMFNTRTFIEKLIKAGASGYILKNTGQGELIEAIETVFSGKTYFSKEVTSAIIEDMQGKKKQSDEFFGVELTSREKEIIKLIAMGSTTNEIADKLSLSHYTIETHRKTLLNKLRVRNTAGLVKYAFQNGLTE